MFAATPEIDAALKLVSGGFKPLTALVRSIAQGIGRIAPASWPPPNLEAPAIPMITRARDGKAVLTKFARAVMTAQTLTPHLAGTITTNIAHITGHDPNDTARAFAAPHTLDGDAASVAASPARRCSICC